PDLGRERIRPREYVHGTPTVGADDFRAAAERDRTCRRKYTGQLMTSLDLSISPLDFVELGGYRMAYRQWGNLAAPDAVILLHGITSSSLSWVRVAPRLAGRSRVIAVDLKGHGDSDRPRAGYRLADQADEVAGLCRALGLQQVSLVGHSWGGGVALHLAARGPLAMRRLVLEDPAL